MFRLLLTILWVGLIGFSACQQPVVYSHTEALSMDGWRSEDLVPFRVKITDTVSPHRLDLHLRHDGRYPYSNLFLFIRTTAPTGETIRDTIEYTLADPSGRWRGKGIGGQYQHTIPYKYQVVFPYSGVYLIEVEHGMRIDPLPRIKDLGLTIKVEK